MSIFLLFVIFLLLLILYKSRVKPQFKHLMEIFPGPPDYPVIGNLLSLSQNPVKMFKKFRGFSKEYSTFRFRLPHTFSIHVTTCEDAESVFSSSTNLKKHFIYDFMRPWIGDGLLTSTDAKWHSRRKMLTPSFHFSMLRQFIDVMVENSERLVQKFLPECDKYQTDIKPFVSDCALFTICETSMGTKLAQDDIKSRRYMDSVKRIGWLMVYRLISPWFHNDFIYNLVHGVEETKHLDRMHSFTNDVIMEREKNLKDSDIENMSKLEDDDFISKKRMAMLDLLIKEKRSNKINMEGIREEVDTFMFEGHDTVSVSLNFTLLLLANYPEVQQKIVDELDGIFGSEKKRITYQDLQQMNYLEMVIKESLRLYPSVPIIGRHLTQTMDMNGKMIPPGTYIAVHVLEIHRNPKHFPEPDKFDPERFSPENSRGRHPFAFVPFSAGPRNCIGQKYAMLEMKCVLASLLWNFILEPVQKEEDVILIIDIVLRNKGPLNIKFRHRCHKH